MKIDRVCMECRSKDEDLRILKTENSLLSGQLAELKELNMRLHNENLNLESLLKEGETYIKSLERRLCELQPTK